jgi:hypothetical protein
MMLMSFKRPVFRFAHAKRQSLPSASSSIVSRASYRERFARLDERDGKEMLATEKQKVNDFFSVKIREDWRDVLDTFSDEFVKELGYTTVMYKAPLLPHQRINLRTKMLPYLEHGTEDQRRFVEYVLNFYNTME